MPTEPSPQALGRDRAITALGMALFGLTLGYAIDIKLGDYCPWALFWLTISIALCVAAVVMPALRPVEWLSGKILGIILVIAIAVQAGLLLYDMGLEAQPVDSSVALGIVAIAVLGCLQFFNLRGLRIPLLVIMAVAFFFVGQVALDKLKDPHIDVFAFQYYGASALTHGHNPYAFRYPNVYPRDTPFYGPGVVDRQGYLTYGFPYPPLSLLMVLPGYWLGDVRYADVMAMALSAGLMALAGRGRLARFGALAGALFLLTPRAMYVLQLAWTEPLLTLNFSLAMFCACRWRKALPYALGLFFATKQYTVLALPLLPLLVDGPYRWRELRSLVARAGLVVAALNLPFLFWNINAFTRSIVEFQFVQPFRTDALSYLVFVYNQFHGLKLPLCTPLLMVLPAYGLCLWRCPRTPAGFAAALTLIDLIFFAFNKQAFCNYYYFVIATACWAIAAAQMDCEMQPQRRRDAEQNAERT